VFPRHEVLEQVAEDPFVSPLVQVPYSMVETTYLSVLEGEKLPACLQEQGTAPNWRVSPTASREPTNPNLRLFQAWEVGWGGRTVSGSSGWEDIRRLIPLSCDGSSVLGRNGAPAKYTAGAVNYK
jgi:hypothetical protein